MYTSPNNQLLSRFEYSDLVDFITDLGWVKTETQNGNWLVFTGMMDVSGDPLEIVLPKEVNKTDPARFMALALNTLSAVMDVDLEDLVLQIKYHDRDVLRVHNPDPENFDSISLRVASQQVGELKQIVAYSACSEENQKPFYINSHLLIAKRMVEDYRFGHTFRGSFGFTVETPAISRAQFPVQKSALPQVVTDYEYKPIYRKVMERIVRGLILTERATIQRNGKLLVDHYKEGFNSNMCRAIVNMSMGKQIPLEFEISWSSRMKPHDENINSPKKIRFEEDSYDTLEYAANLLSELESEDVTIHGLITELKANDNPLGLDTSRSIIVRWEDELEGKIYNVYVVLDKDDYIKAIQAHREWMPVSIKGTLKLSKSHWRLIEYHDFNIAY